MVKTPNRLANGQRLTSSIDCEIISSLLDTSINGLFTSRNLRATNVVLGLPWLDDEQASLKLGTTRVFTPMDGRALEIQTKNRRHEYLLKLCKVKKFMRKTRRSMGRNVEFYVINVTLAAEKLAEFGIGEEFTAGQRENFLMLFYDDFIE
jgi:hypothetical protein